MKIGDTLVGRYELRVTLGSGCHGEVFAARDLRSRRDVAVKVLDGAAVSPEKFDAMASVISAAGRTDHPVVVLPRVQLGLTEAPPFVVGELVAGEDLSSLVARGPVPWQRGLDVALACAEGLCALAEATGVAHRALKPGNVRINANGEVRVLDFGIAELGVRAVRPRDGERFVEYRAPEQITGAAGDAGSDVFSLGVLLFEMMTGIHPHSESSAFKAAYKVMTQKSAPRPSELAPMIQLPSQVEALITRALALEPSARFKGVVELRQHIAMVRRSPGMISRTRASITANPTAGEEATQSLQKPPEDEDLTTAINLPLLRSLERMAPPKPEFADSAKGSAPEPALASTPMRKDVADAGRTEPAPGRTQPIFMASPELEAEPPTLNVILPARSVERAEAPETAAIEEKTQLLSIEDRRSRRRERGGGAPVAPVADATLELPVRPVAATAVNEQDGGAPTDGEVTTVLTRQMTATPLNAPSLPAAEPVVTTVQTRQMTATPLNASPLPAAEPVVATDPEKPAGRPDHERALPRGLVLLNVGCLILLVLGLYALFAD